MTTSFPINGMPSSEARRKRWGLSSGSLAALSVLLVEETEIWWLQPKDLEYKTLGPLDHLGKQLSLAASGEGTWVRGKLTVDEPTSPMYPIRQVPCTCPCKGPVLALQ